MKNAMGMPPAPQRAGSGSGSGDSWRRPLPSTGRDPAPTSRASSGIERAMGRQADDMYRAKAGKGKRG
jgi:hypothetical protein